MCPFTREARRSNPRRFVYGCKQHIRPGGGAESLRLRVRSVTKTTLLHDTCSLTRGLDECINRLEQQRLLRGGQLFNLFHPPQNFPARLFAARRFHSSQAEQFIDREFQRQGKYDAQSCGRRHNLKVDINVLRVRG